MAIHSYTSDNHNDRTADAHDDMIGDMMTGITGANQWLTANIGDTVFPLQWLRNNSNDFYCLKAQSPHTRKQGASGDSIHIHYIMETAYTAGQTLAFDLYYAWVIPGTVFPSLSGWQQALSVTKIPNAATNLPALYTGITALVSNFAPPSPEGYGTGLLVRIVRGNGTYAGNLGIFWTDAHIVKDRNGSVFEASDTQ